MKRSGFLVGLTPNVIRLGWVSLLADISSEMLYPVIPIFLTTVLGTPVSAVGLIEGVAEGVASLLKSVSGRYSDLTGRRRSFVFIGYVISAIAKPIIAMATGWPCVLFSRSLDRLGKGVRSSPRDALLADSVSREYLGKAFGWHRGMDTVGAILGPLIALGFIAKFQENLRWIFVVSFVPAILGAFVVLTVKDVRKSTDKPRHLKSASEKVSFWKLPKDFRTYLFAWFCFSIANSSDMFLILRAKELGSSTTLTILLYTFYNLVYAIASPGLGHLSDRIGRKGILTVGLLIFTLVYLGFVFSDRPWQLWILFGIYGIYIAATDGVGKALAVDMVSSDIRASAIGLLGTVTGVATLLASPIAGLLWGVGSWATFVYGAAGALVAALIISFKLKPSYK